MNPGNLKIGILETGRPPDALREIHGDYPEMMANWLAPFGARYQSYPVLENTLPDDPKECNIWVITGSRSGTYESLEWIPPLEQFVRASRDAGSKMIGICFGHQIIAQALGGKVEKSDKGWGLGVHRYSTANWPEGLAPSPGEMRFQAFHQDQVTRKPKEAVRTASSDFCENAALWYPGFALTVQGHPEMSKEYSTALLLERRGSVLPEKLVDDALAGIDGKTTQDILARYLRDNISRI